MTTDRKREAEMRESEVPSSYVPQRNLPMPPLEFQTPSQSTGGLQTSKGGQFDDHADLEPASLRNFSVR
jgi:hypothetical protein